MQHEHVGTSGSAGNGVLSMYMAEVAIARHHASSSCSLTPDATLAVRVRAAVRARTCDNRCRDRPCDVARPHTVYTPEKSSTENGSGVIATSVVLVDVTALAGQSNGNVGLRIALGLHAAARLSR